MQTIDIILVVLYLLGMLFLGWYVGRKNNDTEEYFAGGRSMPWYAVGFSVGATFISCGTFIGGPGWAYNDGIIAAMINFTLPIGMMIATYTILPMLYHMKVTTAFEYMHKRFGVRTRLINVVNWIATMLGFIGGFVYVPSLAMEALTGVSFNIWVPIIVIMSILYTIAGGIKAVIWSDMIQSIILIIGVICCAVIATGALDLPLADALQIGREAGLMQSYDFSFNLTGPTVWGMVIAGTFSWIYYFGFEQSQLQRYITTKNLIQLKKTSVLSSAVVTVLYWLCHILGVLLFVFYQTNTPTLDFANANNIMIDFILNYVPAGVKGIIVAAAFAAAMSSIDSMLNSLSAVFIKDIYEPYISKKPNTPMSKTIGFTAICAILIIGFVYIYLGEQTSSILLSLANFTAPFGALTMGTMICSFLLPRVNDKGLSTAVVIVFIAIFTISPNFFYYWTILLGGLTTAILAYILSITVFNDPAATEKGLPYTFKGFNQAMKGKTNEHGEALELFKLDKYAYMMIGIFVACAVILALLQ